MPLFKRFRKQPEPIAPVVPAIPEAPPSKAKGFVPPPPRDMPVANIDPKTARLEQRRQALEAAIERVEASADPDSPFQQRIALLGATLDTIEADIRAATPIEYRDLPALPSTLIEQVEVSLEPVPAVRFRIGPVHFAYEEEIDWAERGTSIVKGDLIPQPVDIDPLIPASIEGPLREELAAHLERSAFSFATDLRDRVVEGLGLPQKPTLADLAIPCPKCGDWQLWGGLCPRCIEHDARLRNLNAERTSVLDERAKELEERQRKVEELPIQRKRLAQTIADIQALQS